jgi:hypothetical protein
VSDSSRVLLVAAVLSAVALAVFAAEIDRAETATPPRLIGQMRLAQWAALLLASTSGITVGFVISVGTGPLVGVDAALALMVAGAAALALQREPRSALLVVTAGLVAHALLTLAHRPGWLPADAFPRWYAVGSSTYDTALAAICAWTWRR